VASPSAFSLLNLYHCMLKQLFTVLVAMNEIDGQTPFKDLTRCFTLLPCSTLFIKCFGRLLLSLLNMGMVISWL
jgi:hypothetical protein